MKNEIKTPSGMPIYFMPLENYNMSIYEVYKDKIYGRVNNTPHVWTLDGEVIKGKHKIHRRDKRTPLRKELSEKLESQKYNFVKVNTAYIIDGKYQASIILPILVNQDINFVSESQLKKYIVIEK